MIKTENIDSEIIHYLRFPLASLVVMLHSEPIIEGWDISHMSMADWGANVAGIFMYGLSHIFTHIAVPLFFMISGFLFFKGLERWDTSLWKRKLKSRAHSLIIPYLIWVVIFAIIHFVRHILPILFADRGLQQLRLWIDENGGLLNMFWSSNQWVAGDINIWGQRLLMTGPFPFHLWFLRDLIVCIGLTPVFFFLLKRNNPNRVSPMAYMTLLVLSICYFTQLQSPINGFSFLSFFYFGFGAFLSLNKISIYSLFNKIFLLFSLLSIVLFCILVPHNGPYTHLGTLLFPFYTFFSVSAVYALVGKYVLGGGKNYLAPLESSSFFVYIIHPFFLGLVWTIINKVVCNIYSVNSIITLDFANNHPISVIVFYLCKVLLSIVISAYLYKVINKISPKFVKLLCGR